MTQQDIKDNISQIPCYWCQSLLGNHPNPKYIVLCDNSGEVLLTKRQGDSKASPMVYCSSDCMVYESHLRYCDRVTRGVFRKNFDVQYGGDTHQFIQKNRQVPDRWTESETAKIIK